MANLVLSLNIVLPLFIVMGAGYFVKCIHLIDDVLAKKMNGVLFHVFLPILLCKNIMESSLESLLHPGIFIFAAVGIFLMFLVLFFLIPRIEPDNAKRGVMIQAIVRSNYSYFGIPLVQSIFPGQDVSVTSLLVVVVVPLFNVLAVVALESFRGGKTDIRAIVKHIATNPLIIGSLVGLVLLLSGIELPAFIKTPMNDLAKIASPLALFLLGASISFSKTSAHMRQLVICVSGKLLVFSILALTIAALLGFRNVELASILAMFGAPTAVNSAVMAQQMGGDNDLATEAVVFSTAFSAFTIFMFIIVLKHLSLIA